MWFILFSPSSWRISIIFIFFIHYWDQCDSHFVSTNKTYLVWTENRLILRIIYIWSSHFSVPTRYHWFLAKTAAFRTKRFLSSRAALNPRTTSCACGSSTIDVYSFVSVDRISIALRRIFCQINCKKCITLTMLMNAENQNCSDNYLPLNRNMCWVWCNFVSKFEYYHGNKLPDRLSNELLFWGPLTLPSLSLP